MKLFEKLLDRSAIRPDPPVPEPTPLPTRHPFEGLGRVALPGEVELRNRAFLLTGSQRLAALAALLLPPVVIVVVAILALAGASGGADPQSMDELLGELEGKLWKELSENIAQVGVIGLTLVISLFSTLRGIRERLFVGPEGIRYQSGMPRWLGPLQGSWSVSADQIRDIRVAPSVFGAAPSLLQLVVETVGTTRRVGLFSFVEPGSYQAGAFRVLTRSRSDPSEVIALFDTLPLVVYARGAGYPVRLPDAVPADAHTKLSLKGKPRVAVALTLVFVGFCYAVIDMGIIAETYAAGAPKLLILLGGLAAGALAWPLLGSSEMSQPVRACVAGLLALTAMAALYPGLIRLNRIGAADPAPYAYRHSEAQALEPVEASSPALDLPDLVELLPGSQPGDVHELWIRRGSLGFDQIDIDALEEWIAGLERSGR